MLILPVDCLILHSIIPLLKQFLKTAPDNTGPHEQPYSDRHYNEQNIRSKDYRITIIPEKMDTISKGTTPRIHNTTPRVMQIR